MTDASTQVVDASAASWRDQPELAAKVPNKDSLANAIDRAGPTGVVALYARLDPTTAPADRKGALAAQGVGPQTVSGNVVTLRVPTAKIATLLALPWVTSVETPSIVMPR